MIANFFVKIFPYIFILSFIYFEFSPVYFYENELIKPFLSFLIIYSWICHDVRRFRPLWLLIFGLFYDFLKDRLSESLLFFYCIISLTTKKPESLISFDFKETWIKFIIYLILYFLIIYLCNYFFENSNYNF